MRKIGRNDRCPCGSGKKYKACCLPNPPASLPSLILHSFLMTLLGPKVRDVEDKRKFLARLILSEAMDDPLWRSVVYDTSRCEILQAKTLERVREALQDHGRQYWFQIVRRVAAAYWHEPSSITIPTRLILGCAPPNLPLEWVDDASVAGTLYFITDEIIEQVFLFMCLASFTDEVERLYRIAGKGISIYEPPDFQPRAFSLNSSVRSYEERRDRFETSAGCAGMWFDSEQVKPVQPSLCYLWGVWLTGKRSPPFVSFSPCSARFELAFFPRQIFDIPFDALITEFSEIVKRVVGVDAPLLNSFLYTLSHAVYEILQYPYLDTDASGIRMTWAPNSDPKFCENVLSHWADVGTMGILRASEDAWCSKLAHAHSAVRKHDPAIASLDKSSFRAILRKLTSLGEFRILDERPALFIQISENTLVLDLLQGELFTRNLLLSIARAGLSLKTGNPTGHWFERQVAGYITRKLRLDPSKVLVSKKIAKQSEIDLAFVFRDVLFVLDCKAMAKDAGYFLGVHSKIRNQVTTIQEEVAKCELRINLLRSGAAEPIIASRDFCRAHSLVCTSSVAYLPTETPELWYGNLPRAGPPNELIETIELMSREPHDSREGG